MDLSPAAIAQTLRAPAGPVGAIWPLIVAGLQEFGIDSPMVQVAAAATVQVECPGWVPRAEKRADPVWQPEIWREQERYWHTGCYGRGLIQTTLYPNYLALENALGRPYTKDPDLLLNPEDSARALAFFFASRHVADPANARNWLRVRIEVNGINRETGLPNGWPAFGHFADALCLEVANG